MENEVKEPKNRIERIQQIYKMATELKLNMTTLVFLMAAQTDREVKTFYTEMKNKFDTIKKTS